MYVLRHYKEMDDEKFLREKKSQNNIKYKGGHFQNAA